MEALGFARTASRIVLGSMNDLAYQARAALDVQPDITLSTLAVTLSQVPCGPIGMRHPSDVALALLSSPSKSTLQ